MPLKLLRCATPRQPILPCLWLMIRQKFTCKSLPWRPSNSCISLPSGHNTSRSTLVVHMMSNHASTQKENTPIKQRSLHAFFKPSPVSSPKAHDTELPANPLDKDSPKTHEASRGISALSVKSPLRNSGENNKSDGIINSPLSDEKRRRKILNPMISSGEDDQNEQSFTPTKFRRKIVFGNSSSSSEDETKNEKMPSIAKPCRSFPDSTDIHVNNKKSNDSSQNISLSSYQNSSLLSMGPLVNNDTIINDGELWADCSAALHHIYSDISMDVRT